MFQRFLLSIARPFFGTGLGTRFPIVHTLYRKFFNLSTSSTSLISQFDIGNDLLLSIQTSDGGPGFELLMTGVYEPFETLLLKRMIKSGYVIFDVGAHVGYYSLISSRLVGKKGKVVSFEPSATNVDLLKKNYIDNNLSNYLIVSKIVSSIDGKKDLYLSADSSGEHSTIASGDNKISVDSVSLDKYVRINNTIPNLVKIDVEGAEGEVVRGMGKLLTNNLLKIVFIEFNSRSESWRFALKKLIIYFDLYIVDEKQEKLIIFSEDLLIKEFDKRGLANILCLRNSAKSFTNLINSYL